MSDLPFKNCFAVDIDVSMVGIQHAGATFLKETYSLPSVLWCSPYNLAYAGVLLDMLPQGHYARQLTPISDPEYKEDWWSVGTHTKKGYGSIGA